MAVLMRRLTGSPPSRSLPTLVVLSAEFWNGGHLLEVTQIDGERVRFHVPCPAPLIPDCAVVCHLRIRGESEEVVVHGRAVRMVEDPTNATDHQVEVEAEGGGRIAFARLYAHALGLPRHRGTRSEERALVRLDATLAWEGHLGTAQILDVSLKGLRVRSSTQAPVRGAPVTVRVRLGFLRQRCLKGIVAWSHGLTTGIELTGMSASDQAWLAGLVDSGLHATTLDP